MHLDALCGGQFGPIEPRLGQALPPRTETGPSIHSPAQTQGRAGEWTVSSGSYAQSLRAFVAVTLIRTVVP
jgi:hypothetical protein